MASNSATAQIIAFEEKNLEQVRIAINLLKDVSVNNYAVEVLKNEERELMDTIDGLKRESK